MKAWYNNNISLKIIILNHFKAHFQTNKFRAVWGVTLVLGVLQENVYSNDVVAEIGKTQNNCFTPRDVLVPLFCILCLSYEGFARWWKHFYLHLKK